MQIFWRWTRLLMLLLLLHAFQRLPFPLAVTGPDNNYAFGGCFVWHPWLLGGNSESTLRALAA